MNIAVRTLKNQMERPSFWQRTFNSGLHPKYREWGLNANPWKIGCCGLLGGFFGAMCGVGGGIVMIPLLYVEYQCVECSTGPVFHMEHMEMTAT